MHSKALSILISAIAFCAVVYSLPAPVHAHESERKACQARLLPRIDGQVIGRDGEPIYLQGKRDIVTPVYDRITASNISRIFTHQYDSRHPERFGAKAVISCAWGNRSSVWFFATGEGNQAFNMHHRDALSAMMLIRFKPYYDHLHEPFSESLMLDLLSMGRRPSIYASSLEELVQWQDHFKKIMKLSEELKTRGRRNPDFDLLYNISRSQGYQLTAEMRDGQLKVVRVDTDSSITTYQQEFGLIDDFNVQPTFPEEIRKRIGKRVSAFPAIAPVEAPCYFDLNPE